MKHISAYMIPILTFITCLVMALAKALTPWMMMPKFDLSLVLVIVLATLTLEAYISQETSSPLLLSFFLSGLCFGLLPWSAGLVGGQEALLLAVAGVLCWGIVAFIIRGLNNITDRHVAGPIGNAFLLYLSFQGVMSIF